MKILLLEDNTTDARLTMHALRQAWPQCVIQHAKTVSEAMGLLNKNNDFDFDVALLDMQLPDGNGIDVLIKIRESGFEMATAMLTGSGDEEVAVAVLKAGADDYMTKSIDYTSKIQQTVEFAIENRKQSMQRETSIIPTLYIEHNPADIDLTQRHMRRYAPYIQIDSVPSCEEALKKLCIEGTSPEDCHYRVILMDYGLPGLPALEFIKTIRQEQKLCVPVIIVTGQGNEELAVQSLKVGANEYLVKRENYITRLPSIIVSAFQRCELIRKQKALTESESKYRLLAENSSDIIFTLDFDLNYTYVSPAIFPLRGFTPEEMTNRNIKEALSPSSYKKLLEAIDIVLPSKKSKKQKGEPTVIELEVPRKDGSTIWVEIKASALTDEKGEPNGILGVSRDISERKAAQEELRKLSRAVTQSPVSIMITDKEGYIEYVNPKFTGLTGYTLDEVLGKKPHLLKSGEHADSYYKTFWDTILSGFVWHGEFHDKKKDGELFWVNTIISSLVDEDGSITHFVAVNEDITDRIKIIDDLKIAKEKAEESNRLKTAFLANMSHEIRTPMNGILGFMDLLNNPHLSEEEKEKYISIVNESGQRLLTTINNIIEVSKIETDQMNVSQTEINLSDFMQYYYDFFEPETIRRGLQMYMDCEIGDQDPVIVTDKYKLGSIFINLINNAIKFTKQGSITIGCNNSTNETVFFVRDTGIGIPEEYRKTIFESFVQSDLNVTRSHEGSGLGLAICDAYAKILEGRIWLESEVGKGSTFYLAIPRKTLAKITA